MCIFINKVCSICNDPKCRFLEIPTILSTSVYVFEMWMKNARTYFLFVHILIVRFGFNFCQTVFESNHLIPVKIEANFLRTI